MPEFQKEIGKEMTTKEIKHIVDELDRLGVQVVNLTGGEPTLRKDLPEIINYISQKGMMPTLATNGFRLYDHIRSGRLNKIEWVMISLDWPDAEGHDKYRGIALFDHAIKGIRALILEKKTTLISMVVTPENLPLMEKMVQFAYDLGAMIEMLPCENIIREQDTAHTVEEISKYIPDIKKWATEIRRLNRIYPNLITDNVTADIVEAGGFGHQNLLHCVTARSFLVINYKGDVVFPCKIHPILKVNVKQRSLYDVYHSYEARKIMELKDSFPFCNGCRLGCAIATSIPTRWATLYEKYIKCFFNGNLF
jgi:MoaA/NifB/PqqE/SkfB family radical SAM enzyme